MSGAIKLARHVFPIVTTRLVIRPLFRGDEKGLFDAFVAAAVEEKLAPDLAKIRVAAALEQQITANSTGTDWSLVFFDRKNPKAFAGALNAHFEIAARSHEVTIGYHTAKKLRRRGYMREALQAIEPKLFEREGITTIVANVRKENEGSAELMRQLDFKERPPVNFDAKYWLQFCKLKP